MNYFKKQKSSETQFACTTCVDTRYGVKIDTSNDEVQDHCDFCPEKGITCVATQAEILVKSVDDKDNYSIASNLDPDQDGFVDNNLRNGNGWTAIARQEAAGILGYDPEEGNVA